jgi:hypothetical protein
LIISEINYSLKVINNIIVIHIEKALNTKNMA